MRTDSHLPRLAVLAFNRSQFTAWAACAQLNRSRVFYGYDEPSDLRGCNRLAVVKLPGWNDSVPDALESVRRMDVHEELNLIQVYGELLHVVPDDDRALDPWRRAPRYDSARRLRITISRSEIETRPPVPDQPPGPEPDRITIHTSGTYQFTGGFSPTGRVRRASTPTTPNTPIIHTVDVAASNIDMLHHMLTETSQRAHELGRHLGQQRERGNA